MTGTPTRPKFDAPALREQIHRLRAVDNTTNLICLAKEYLGMAVVIASAIAFAEYREGWGLAWAWNLPVFGLAIVLMGGFQHRLAGLGHEASHYTFMKNKFWNDFVADIFCMFPILSTVHFYRLFHLAHHQYTNDPLHDPDLVNMGRSKGVADIPMPRWRFVATYFGRMLVSPIAFLRYQWDYLYVNILGKGGNVYMRKVPGGDAYYRGPRLGTILGLIYILGFNGFRTYLANTGRFGWVIPSALIGMTAVIIVTALLPDWAMFQSPFRQPYSSRFAGVARLGFLTVMLTVLAYFRSTTGGRSAVYATVLWLVPMVTTLMAYMLLRDVYQHANADNGRLTNSRVFFADPFTRWAVFVYGQDIHVTHHLFPAIPHYRLEELHELLKREHTDYAAEVVECHGTFANDKGMPTILDMMSKPRIPEASNASVPPSHRMDPGTRVGQGRDSTRSPNRSIRRGKRSERRAGRGWSCVGSQGRGDATMATTVKDSPTTTAANDELAALRRQVVELQRVSSLGVLAGSVCHELNNALTPILNYAKLGLRNPDPEFHRRAFEKILDGAQRATSIAGGVLGLARPQANQRSEADLVRLAEEVLMLTAKDLQKSRVRVEFQADGRPYARINPPQIQQVLLNLVINARQAMPEGGSLRLRVGLDPAGRLAEIQVSDTGQGIKPSDLRRIFEPFFTTKTGPDSSGQGGTGLGLSVCRDIVESHKGRLRAESRPGQGTTFTLRLPSCPSPPVQRGAA